MIKKNSKQGVIVHAIVPATSAAEAGGLLETNLSNMVRDPISKTGREGEKKKGKKIQEIKEAG